MRNFIKIEKVEAKECFDALGNSAVEVEVETEYGDTRNCHLFFRKV